MSDYGFRISKTGTSVITGEDKDMVITSKYSAFKGSTSGSGVISVPRTGVVQTVTVAHGLTYIPSIQSFWEDRDSDYFIGGEFYEFPLGTASGILDFYFRAKSDATNIYLLFTIDDYGFGDPAIDIRYAYNIFIDKGKL